MKTIKNPLISVVMGIYNCEKTLERSLHSVQNQEYTNFECIMCNDGSTDKTLEIATQFTLHDNRFFIIQNDKNEGLSYTLNKCIEKSKGAFIARMDGDDVSLPNRFGEQIEFLQKNKEYSFCGSSINLFDENEIWGYRPYPEKPNKKSFLFGTPFAHPTVMFRQEAILNTPYVTTKSVGRSEDYFLFMSLYTKGLIGYNFVQPLFNYYESKDSFKKRKIQFAFTEFLVRLRGFSMLKILFPLGIFYSLKPLIIVSIPIKIQINLRKFFYKEKSTIMRKVIK